MTPLPRTQPDLFAAAVLPLHRLFFALLPDAAAQDAIQAAWRHVAPSLGDPRATPSHRLHLTLLYLGETAGPRVDWIEAATRAAASLQATSFPVVLDRIASFQGSQPPTVLRAADDANPALLAFQRQLRDACRIAGLRDAGHARFVPHVTLARPRIALPVPVAVASPVRWQATRFVLVHSIAGCRDYARLGEWALGA
ncbi:RNA 2',3'-cyclic phosphodiesterase [Luteimonas sp. BDR2-5]|uniref:RNA 2',3'-cyclic phosphodiesterase n=1 Tax=Proluteimonas luteida TaxID=2878685 RepID=UPI001E5CC838|nr:RNA 2',3'-cyclic phosphodiesterase [Luteimonas sp. BDR2-5]MCD9026674.1 RNA 2',3'-cyclic phosphodiesterase [Luteimonas sp. BDR2-5]